MEHEPAGGGGGVDALGQGPEPDATFLELGGEAGEVLHGPAETVELPDDEGVPAAQQRPQPVELGAAGQLPGRGVGVDVGRVDAAGGEGVELQSGVLVVVLTRA